MIPRNTCLGNLRIIEIYEYLDGPKLFCARNEVGTSFVVYWCDVLDGAEGWLYLPISYRRLDRLRRRELAIRDAYASAESGVYIAYTTAQGRNDTAEFFSIKQLDLNLLPPKGFYVESVDVIEKGEYAWNHEIKIQREGRNTTPNAEATTSVLRQWTAMIEAMMNCISASQSLHLTSAEPGSLEVKLGASNDSVALESLRQLKKVLHRKRAKLGETLYQSGLEPYRLKNLFETLRRFNLNLTINARTRNGLDGPIVMTPDGAADWIKILEPIASSVLGTDKIPQADEIDKILDIVAYKRDGIDVTPALLNIAPRQVSYYVHAASTLGLLNRDGYLTSVGRFVASQERVQQYTALASRFESSDCGWAWLVWSNVTCLPDLDGESAFDFLSAVAPGLSESTAKRRAVTLRQWVKKLTPYHYQLRAKADPD